MVGHVKDGDTDHEVPRLDCPEGRRRPAADPRQLVPAVPGVGVGPLTQSRQITHAILPFRVQNSAAANNLPERQHRPAGKIQVFLFP